MCVMVYTAAVCVRVYIAAVSNSSLLLFRYAQNAVLLVPVMVHKGVFHGKLRHFGDTPH